MPSMGGHEYRYPFCTKSLEGKLFYMPLGYPNSIGMASEKGGQEFGIQIFPACSLYIYTYMHTDLSSIALYYITLYQLHHIYIYIISCYNMVYYIVIVYYCYYHDCYIELCCIILYYIMLYYVISYCSIV